MAVARHPDIRIRDVAAELGVTERTAQALVAELVTEGYLERIRIGRRNRYAVRAQRLAEEPTLDLVAEGVGGLDRPPECEAVVVACSDHRVQVALQRFLGHQGLAGRAEVILWPGGAPALAGPHGEEIFRALGDVFARRSATRLVFLSHDGCEVPDVPRLAGSSPPATFGAVRKWARRVAGRTRERIGVEPELWLLDRGHAARIRIASSGRRTRAARTSRRETGT